MTIRSYRLGDAPAIAALFTRVFSNSEGEAEGRRIGKLAKHLLEQTDPNDRSFFVAVEADRIIAAVGFTRMTCPNEHAIFLLAPMAVHTAHQRQGVGTALIQQSLQEMSANGAKFFVTYGDPEFYQRFGFHPCSTDALEPPCPLSQPEGWLAQTADHHPLAEPLGPCSCVKALDDPAYW